MAELPQSVDVDLNRSNLQINQRCGNCKHLKRIAHPAYEKPCKDLEMNELSKPCKRFSADPTMIKFRGERNARHAVDFMQDLSDDKLRLYAALLNGEARTRKYGFHFGMTVYILAIGNYDCLENYRRMKVVSADNVYVNLQSNDGFTAMVYHKSVLSPTQYQKKRKWLIANERLKDNTGKTKIYHRASTALELRLQKAKAELDSPDFDVTDSKSFAVTTGKMRTTKIRPNASSERYAPLDQLVRTR